jgi:hypothetical protein
MYVFMYEIFRGVWFAQHLPVECQRVLIDMTLKFFYRFQFLSSVLTLYLIIFYLLGCTGRNIASTHS